MTDIKKLRLLKQAENDYGTKPKPLLENYFYMPQRIQRKRTKGYKMPPNTVSVTRPGEWGNPFVIGGWYKIGNGQPGLSWIRCIDESMAKRTGYTKLETAEQCIEWYRNLLRLYPIREERLLRIRGKNLACFCPLDKPCHADVLLELANR